MLANYFVSAVFRRHFGRRRFTACYDRTDSIRQQRPFGLRIDGFRPLRRKSDLARYGNFFARFIELGIGVVRRLPTDEGISRLDGIDTEFIFRIFAQRKHRVFGNVRRIVCALAAVIIKRSRKYDVGIGMIFRDHFGKRDPAVQIYADHRFANIRRTLNGVSYDRNGIFEFRVRRRIAGHGMRYRIVAERSFRDLHDRSAVRKQTEVIFKRPFRPNVRHVRINLFVFVGFPRSARMIGKQRRIGTESEIFPVDVIDIYQQTGMRLRRSCGHRRLHGHGFPLRKIIKRRAGGIPGFYVGFDIFRNGVSVFRRNGIVGIGQRGSFIFPLNDDRHRTRNHGVRRNFRRRAFYHPAIELFAVRRGRQSRERKFPARSQFFGFENLAPVLKRYRELCGRRRCLRPQRRKHNCVRGHAISCSRQIFIFAGRASFESITFAHKRIRFQNECRAFRITDALRRCTRCIFRTLFVRHGISRWLGIATATEQRKRRRTYDRRYHDRRQNLLFLHCFPPDLVFLLY